VLWGVLCPVCAIIYYLEMHQPFKSSTAIQPYTHIPLSSESSEVDRSEEDDLFKNYNDFHTQARIELPFKITLPIIEDIDTPTYPTLENTSRALDFHVHIPPIYFNNQSFRKCGGTKGGFMASFGAHSSLVGTPHALLAPTFATEKSSKSLKRKNLGYSTHCFSVGYIHTLKEWKRYVSEQPQPPADIDKNKMGTLVSWIHWDMSGSQGSQVCIIA